MWLDTLRATAVLAVVAYHVDQMSPLSGSALARATHYGQYGVDLFFVLSGWLIGTLLWQEGATFGNISLARFWARRAARTIPPYLIMLGISWAAVAAVRNEEFDPGYLMFVQNYYERMPFFLVSWSLCVEEHFYAAAPVAAVFMFRASGKRASGCALLLLAAASPLARAVEYGGATHDVFGYSATATHLRLDGLAIGFVSSFIAAHWPSHWAAKSKSLGATLTAPVALAGIVFVEVIGGPARYILLPTLLGILFGLALAIGLEVGAGRREGTLSRLAKWIALCSYSAYLVHPLAIHVTGYVMDGFLPRSGILYWPLVVCNVILSTMAFYWLVERTTLYMRDALAPRRGPWGSTSALKDRTSAARPMENSNS